MNSCPVCGEDTKPAYRVLDVNRRVSNEIFEYDKCPSCGTTFLVDVPSDLGRYYESDYYEIPTLDRLDAIAQKDRNKIDTVNTFAAGRRLLEIGPAFGVFAWQAKQEGYDVAVIEMDTRCCRFLDEVVKVGVTQSASPHEALASLPAHDVIAIWHVIEHLPDVPAFLEAAANNLAPGGILVVAQPNPEATQWKIMGAQWPHLDAPRHLTLIPADTLTRLASEFGLHRVRITADDADAKSWNRFGWQRFLMNRFQSKIMQRLMFVLGYAVAFVMRPVDRRAMRGSAFTVVYRKNA